MREYETWEVIKMLSENQKLKFTDGIKIGFIDKVGREKGANTIGVVDEVIFWIDPNGEIFNTVSFNKEFLSYKWTLVRTPVTWQEAIQAWIDGKTIKCCYKCCYPKNDAKMISSTFYPSCLVPSREALTTGTWYIEGDPDE